MPNAIDQNPALLEIARESLREQGFAINIVPLPGADFSITTAEDSYSVVALLAGTDWAEMSVPSRIVASGFHTWVTESELYAKRWDAYLLCLAEHPLSSSDDFFSAEEFESDTRRVRKYIRTGVFPEPEPVRRALAPFLGLETPTSRSIVDPLKAMREKLRGRGVDPEVADQAVESFTATGDVRLSQ